MEPVRKPINFALRTGKAKERSVPCSLLISKVRFAYERSPCRLAAGVGWRVWMDTGGKDCFVAASTHAPRNDGGVTMTDLKKYESLRPKRVARRLATSSFWPGERLLRRHEYMTPRNDGGDHKVFKKVRVAKRRVPFQRCNDDLD
jgi:hypothetical protein